MVTTERARAIMGANFFDFETVEQTFVVRYSSTQLRRFDDVPFSEEALVLCSRSHFLFPGYPLSISDLKSIHNARFSKQHWYSDEQFTKAKVRLIWHLLRLDPYPGSLNKPYGNQRLLLPSSQEIPRASEVLYGFLLSHLHGGTRVLANTYVRCADHCLTSLRAFVGSLDSHGISLHACWDNDIHPNLGLASAWKIDLLPA